MGYGGARDNAMVPLRRGRGAKSVRLDRGRNGFALQRSLEGLEENLPLWPDLILNWLTTPSGAVLRERAGLHQNVGGEHGHHVVGDGQYLPKRLLLLLLHVDDEYSF